MKKIRLQIRSCKDRENVVVALANNSYPVIVELDKYKDHFVIFEIDETKVTEVVE